MENLRVDAHFLPSALYRIQYDGCRTTWNERGLWSESMDTPNSPRDLVAAIRAHLDWHERDRLSPFISVFDNEERAENWALVLHRDGVQMAEIDTSFLENTVAFPLERAQRVLTAEIPRDPQHNGEWLVLHHIPAAAIRHWIGRDSIQEHRENRREEREETRAERRLHRWRMQDDPLYHYVDELGGWYDEDEEVEERHIADDIMRLIEDNY